jgi:hypothetical protein
MGSGLENPFSVLALHETKSVVTLQLVLTKVQEQSPQVNYQFAHDTSISLLMAVCVKAKAPADCLSEECVETI